MAKQSRPRRPSGEETRQIRVSGDLADMLGWIVRLEGGSAPQIIDPLVRPEIEARYKRIESFVEKVKAADEAVRLAEEAASKHRRRSSGGS